jgi:hypothetical protein
MIILSDEAVFKISGTVKQHNCVYWSPASPTVHVDKAVNCCAAIGAAHLSTLEASIVPAIYHL